MPNILGQFGIGVTNLSASLTFYTSTLGIGLVQTQEFDTPDFQEIVLAFPPASSKDSKASGAAAGSELALMQYKDKSLSPPTNQQGKVLFFVDDVEEVMERCRQAGVTIDSDVGEGEGVLEYIGIVRDPDGFLVEFVPYMFLQAAQGGSKI